MNQGQVKDLLLKLRPTVPEFTVIFTGKSSRKVNGLYKPYTAEILLHNKNFNSDLELIYTAVHEFAHHLHFTSEAPPVGNRCHTKAFWLIFHGLLAEAIESGIYVPVVDSELTEAVVAVKAAMKAEGEAMKRTGQMLLHLVAQCGKHHVRFEDMADRELGISRATAKTAMAAFAQDVAPDAGPDSVRLLTKVKDPELRRELTASGGTLIEKQGQATGVSIPAPRPSSEPAPIRSKERERAQLEAKLARLEEAAEEIRTRIQTLDEEPEAAAAHPKDRQLRWAF